MLLLKKIEHAIDINKIQNNNVTTAELDSRLNDLKNQHIADEVKKINDKTKKTAVIFFVLKVDKNKKKI